MGGIPGLFQVIDPKFTAPNTDTAQQQPTTVRATQTTARHEHTQAECNPAVVPPASRPPCAAPPVSPSTAAPRPPPTPPGSFSIDALRHPCLLCSDLQDVPAGALAGDPNLDNTVCVGEVASTQCFSDYVDTDQNSQNGSEGEIGVDASPDSREDAIPAVLKDKVGGKAQHPTLGNVTVLHLGALGASIEFFSMRSMSVKQRNVLRFDIRNLPGLVPKRNQIL